MILIALYALTIPAANWLIGHVGTLCIQSGPCLIPVAPGTMAPSGVLMIGLALLLRDIIQRRYGVLVSLYCIGCGVIISSLLAPPALVLASAAAFAISELADFAVYTPLWRRNFIAAVAVSCGVGAMVDSGIFLFLAFDSFDHMMGQIIGKLYAVSAFIAVRHIHSRLKPAQTPPTASPIPAPPISA
jgi:uncharacterized PurR-regulated membrane protein YhhQ (DUF165 family)